ncbi:MAG: aminotransferase class IV family protein [Phycisphaerae bacterium]|nr:aminotransferase class IV family protein [Phycisphaerae bacterium]
MEKVFLNGKIIDADKATVSVTDSSYLYGIGLFETMRAVNGKVFRLADHLARLNRSAEALSIFNSFSDEQIAQGIDKLLQVNEVTEARLRLELSNGPVQPNGTTLSNLLITAPVFTPYPAGYYDRGVRVILTDFRQSSKDPYAGHKTTCYGPRLMALRNAHEKLAAEALWFTTENALAEGCISNVFLVKDGQLCTPPVNTPILPGIARKTVIEIAEQENITCHEQPLSVDDLLKADEVFLTNVVMEVLPVVAVEAHTVGDGKPGSIAKKLSEKYKRRLEE